MRGLEPPRGSGGGGACWPLVESCGFSGTAEVFNTAFGAGLRTECGRKALCPARTLSPWLDLLGEIESLHAGGRPRARRIRRWPAAVRSRPAPGLRVQPREPSPRTRGEASNGLTERLSVLSRKKIQALGAMGSWLNHGFVAAVADAKCSARVVPVWFPLRVRPHTQRTPGHAPVSTPVFRGNPPRTPLSESYASPPVSISPRRQFLLRVSLLLAAAVVAVLVLLLARM